MALDFSWIRPRALAVGCAPLADNADELAAAGITAVLNLQEAGEWVWPPESIPPRFRWAGVPIVDSFRQGVPTVEQLAEAVETLRAWRASGEVVYVHCALGLGRSPLVCMAYLAVAERLSLARAISLVHQRRPNADPTPQQMLRLCEYVVQALP